MGAHIATEVRPKAYSYLRLSTKAQLKGDGKRRQAERSRDYARDHGLELDRKLKLDDFGKSAYTGENIRDGALGKFLAKAKSGEIPRGSVLIVESLDRISRLNVGDALAIFLEILNAGIDIVTLIDGHKFESGKTTPADLIISVVAFARSNEESASKADRLRKAWENKRQKGDKRKLTSICPAWLRLTNNHFELNSERVSTIQEIFGRSAEGTGSFTIARLLNENRIRTFNESDGWHPSYITKILQNRAVIGEFQAHKTGDNGKRIPAGEVRRDYFPKIIEVDLFYRVQKLRAVRNVSGRGRNGKTLTNLFKGPLFCDSCSGRIKFQNKGPLPKGGYYLVCERATRRLGCRNGRWKYQEFESSFLTFVRELKLKEASSLQTKNNQLEKLRNTIVSLAGEKHLIETRMNRIRGAIEQADASVAYLVGVLETLALQHSKLGDSERDAASKVEDLKDQYSELYENEAELRKLISKLQESDNGNSSLLRTRISSDLSLLVDFIRIDAVVRAFDVTFKDGSVREVYTDPDNPSSDGDFFVSRDGLLKYRDEVGTEHFQVRVAVPMDSLEAEVFGDRGSKFKWEWREFAADQIPAALEQYKKSKQKDPFILELNDSLKTRPERKPRNKNTDRFSVRLGPSGKPQLV